jgi:hypothetical protein
MHVYKTVPTPYEHIFHFKNVLFTVVAPRSDYFMNPKQLRSNKTTNSVEQEPEGSSSHSQQPATGPCPEPV